MSTADCWYFEWRKARKAHTCVTCHGVIGAGTAYLYDSGVLNGKPWSAKTCGVCIPEAEDEWFDADDRRRDQARARSTRKKRVAAEAAP